MRVVISFALLFGCVAQPAEAFVADDVKSFATAEGDAWIMYPEEAGDDRSTTRACLESTGECLTVTARYLVPSTTAGASSADEYCLAGPDGHICFRPGSSEPVDAVEGARTQQLFLSLQAAINEPSAATIRFAEAEDKVAETETLRDRVCEMDWSDTLLECGTVAADIIGWCVLVPQVIAFIEVIANITLIPTGGLVTLTALPVCVTWKLAANGKNIAECGGALIVNAARKLCEPDRSWLSEWILTRSLAKFCKWFSNSGPALSVPGISENIHAACSILQGVADPDETNAVPNTPECEALRGECVDTTQPDACANGRTQSRKCPGLADAILCCVPST